MKKRGRRILSVILTAVMVFALLPVFSKPMVVKADDAPAHVPHTEQDDRGCRLHGVSMPISTEYDLKQLLEYRFEGYLINDIEITDTLEIKFGKTISLCLNGYSITQTEDKDVFSIKGNLHLYDVDGNSGEITHSSGKDGRGIYIGATGTFTMNGGTIKGNNADNGGGVYNLGDFTLNGGYIEENNADIGGGVYNVGTFTMNGGTISGNNADTGGGVYNVETFTMEGGTIKENKATRGGGVYNNGTFTMTGGTIEVNVTKEYGGGVYNYGTFKMEGGTIKENKSSLGGGVVNYKKATFTMNEGTISGNNADTGGGVYNTEGTFTMIKGTITGNNANRWGGGVYNYGTFKMEGGTIKDNKASERGSGVYSNKLFVKEGGEIDGSIENLGRNICAITFNANNGSDKTIIQYVNPNEDINLASNKFSYGNYPFGCWNTKEDGTGDSYEDNATINIKGDLELYARWIEKSYDVTFKVNNGSWFDKTNDDRVVTILRYVGENKELKLNASDIPSINPVNGYKGSWDAEPDTVNALTENKTYTYTFEPIEYTIHYYPNGGVGTMLDQARKYDDKKTLTTNAFALEGYTFTGWNTAADGSGTSYTDENDGNLSSTDGETVTLFAQWQANNYTVKFDANGGVGTMDDQSRKYDDKTALTANVFTYEGKTFNGWNTAADGSGTPYKDEEVNNLSSTEGDMVTLYAQWTTNTYTVSWKNHDGTVLETDTDVAYGSTPSYDGETPVKEKEGNKEYTFSGWTPEIDTVKGAATYTATYSENEIIYTVTFDANGGKADTTTGTTNAEFKLSSLPTPTYEGYTFKGWFTEATGGSEISADTVYTQDTTIYAQWEKVEEPEEPQKPTEPEVPEITEPEPDPEIPEKDWLDDLKLSLGIAAELTGSQTVTYSGDFALSYDIMLYLVEHPDITLIYTVTYEGIEYTITIPGGKAIADPNIPWYGPLWLLANYGGDNVPEVLAGSGKYTVVTGDTLSGIAAKFNTTVEYLAQKNGIKDPNYIIVGQVIVY